MKTVNRCAGFYGLMEAKTAGAHAAFRNEPWSSNPYSVGSREWDAWVDGFNACLAQLAAEQEQIGLRIAGGEPIHVLEAEADGREPQEPWRVKVWRWYRALLGIN